MTEQQEAVSQVQTPRLVNVELLVVTTHHNISESLEKDVLRNLTDRQRFLNLVGPRINDEILNKHSVTYKLEATRSNPISLELLQGTSKIGAITFRLSIRSDGLSIRELQQVSRRASRWVQDVLSEGGKHQQDPLGERYNVLILWKTDPEINSKEKFVQVPGLIGRLSSIQSDIAQFYDQKFIEKLVSTDLGFLKHDFYLVRGGLTLIFDPKFPTEQRYILEQFMACIKQLRIARSLLGLVNRELDLKVEKTRQIRDAPDVDLDLEILGLSNFRRSILDAISTIFELSGNYEHLRYTVRRCDREFGLSSLSEQIKNKLEYLAAAYQQLVEARQRRFERNIQLIGSIVAAIAAVLALLAIPGAAQGIVKALFGLVPADYSRILSDGTYFYYGRA